MDATVYSKKTGKGVARHVLPGDASLISAAQNMYEALKDIAEYTGEGPINAPWQEIVKSLGNKARKALHAVKGVS